LHHLARTHILALITAIACSLSANAQHAHSKYVVMMKLHMAFEEETPVDLFLYIRAVAEEVTQAGYHFYLLSVDRIQLQYNTIGGLEQR